MTLSQLQWRVIFSRAERRLAIWYRGRYYFCHTNNTLATDRIGGSDDWNGDREVHCGYTLRQAYMALWNECKSKNNLR